MIIPADFFDVLITDVCQIYQLEDADNVPKEDDPIVRLCATLAYNQAIVYCRKEFHAEERLERYPGVSTPIYLRSQPVDDTQPMEVWVNFALRDPASWSLRAGVLYFLSSTPSPTECYEDVYDVEVRYTGGLALPSEIGNLYSALIFQTIGNFNRRDVLGFAQTSGERGSSKKPDDHGSVLEAAAQLLDPLRYYGNCERLE